MAERDQRLQGMGAEQARQVRSVATQKKSTAPTGWVIEGRRFLDSPSGDHEPVKSRPVVIDDATATGSAPRFNPPLPPGLPTAARPSPSMTKPNVPDPDQLLTRPPVEKPKF